jgi:hypothetical protein
VHTRKTDTKDFAALVYGHLEEMGVPGYIHTYVYTYIHTTDIYTRAHTKTKTDTKDLPAPVYGHLEEMGALGTGNQVFNIICMYTHACIRIYVLPAPVYGHLKEIRALRTGNQVNQSICMYIRACICIHAYIHTNAHTQQNGHTYTKTHTHTQKGQFIRVYRYQKQQIWRQTFRSRHSAYKRRGEIAESVCPSQNAYDQERHALEKEGLLEEEGAVEAGFCAVAVEREGMFACVREGECVCERGRVCV